MSAWAIDDELLERKDFDMTEKVLIAILKRLGAQEKVVWPRHQWLADRMGCSVRTIQRVLEKLEKKGVVEQHERRWKIAQYTITGQFVTGQCVVSSPDNVSCDSPDNVSGHKKDIQSKHKQIKIDDAIASPLQPSRPKRSDPKRTNETPVYNPLGAEIIKAFEAVAAKNKKCYGHPVQRDACDQLINDHGLDDVLKVISLLPKSNTMPYFPRVYSPKDLYEKWEKLRDAFLAKKGEITSKQTITIGL